jgi:hypothetical protein
MLRLRAAVIFSLTPPNEFGWTQSIALGLSVKNSII